MCARNCSNSITLTELAFPSYGNDNELFLLIRNGRCWRVAFFAEQTYNVHRYYFSATGTSLLESVHLKMSTKTLLLFSIDWDGWGRTRKQWNAILLIEPGETIKENMLMHTSGKMKNGCFGYTLGKMKDVMLCFMVLFIWGFKIVGEGKIGRLWRVRNESHALRGTYQVSSLENCFIFIGVQ